MSLRSRAGVLAVALPLLLVLCGAVVLGSGTAVAEDPVSEFDTNTTMTVELQGDGDARWVITTAFTLESANQTEAFDDIAADFVAGDDDLGRAATEQSFERAAALADATTDREMAVSAVERDTEIDETVDNGTGLLTLSFTWENFARTDGGHLFVDDVLVTDQGLWLPGLDADQTLVIQAPPGGGVVDGNVPARNGELRWEGPATFDNETLQSTFIRETNSDGDGNSDTTPPPNNGNDNGTSLLAWLVAGGAIVALAAVLAYLLVQRRDEITIPNPTADDETNDRTDEPNTRAVQSGNGSSAAGSASAETDETTALEIDEELLSDEERVRRLLEANGGRMKQAAIVKETDWSNAKVSQLLSSMAEDGEIRKIRIGRENLITFPDEDITSPTDDN